MSLSRSTQKIQDELQKKEHETIRLKGEILRLRLANEKLKSEIDDLRKTTGGAVCPHE
jgi:septal ring factor EnvC (AmiA/AmiB activator)